MPRRACSQRLLVVIAGGLMLAGCGQRASGVSYQTPAPESPGTVAGAPVVTPYASPQPNSPASATSATPTHSNLSPATNDTAAVLAAYAAYDEAFARLSTLAPEARTAELARFAVDPLYSTVLKTLAARDQAGQVGYGKVILHPKVVSLRPHAATIADCQDTSRNGLMEKATGKRLTVGVPQFLRYSEMVRGNDAVWRVSVISRTVDGKC